ncbi:hypothetical protein EDD18DRAFT_1137735 [Armillaria luteobubalina]|uniref:Uncharacterized protein n=1 Tax=Armillaria luteobubalina TaxID=153913 RepID=A0AA39QJD1_9AGAR|nr:hypothetical protein EDD18DRAFT_1137735 [Armillaria luteobubalina]
MKKRANDLLKHPLFLDIGSVRYLRAITMLKELESKAQASLSGEEDLPISAIDRAMRGMVFPFGGSNFGSVRLIDDYPRSFPDQSAG